MAIPLEYGAVPKPLLEGMESLSSPPPPGSGRARIDFSFNVWTFGFLLCLVLLGFLAVDRLHTEQGVQGVELKAQGDLLKILNERQARMERGQTILRRDMRTFPLHKHVGLSRAEIYPPKEGEDFKDFDIE